MIRATREERRRRLPGDDLIQDPIGSFTHAVTIHAARGDVWPWLAQMGAGRAGWYSYDWIDNGGHASAARILPEFQDVTVGAIFPALPGATDGFEVLAANAGRSLVLGWRLPEGPPLVTWSFVLEPAGPDSTRLITRARGSRAYRFQGLPGWLSRPVAGLVHGVMERRQLRGLAARVERRRRATPVTPA